MTSARRPGRDRGGLALLVVLAYVPLLISAPSRIPADTKLYLYLSPGRLLSQAPLTWDTSQFGGWVPHQIIAYLWPQGPWYWLHEQLGTPDWVAHRLWVGSVLLVAALGVRRLARQLDLGRTPATVAGVAYMLSPYVLPYLSRTSAMLLPWAALGWIVSLTIAAATSSHRWRHPAMLALVLASCSAVNATAVLMIAPAPVLWLVHAALAHRISWRRAASTATRIGLLAAGTSTWWIAMLRTQGRLGADVLGFSESLEATSFTTLATETIRGTGYWLFYIRDEATFATTASRSLMEDPIVLALTYALPLAGLVGLAAVRWAGRRWAAAMLAVGMVLAVGVHPISDPSPLMSGLAENSRSGLALALRSSARATPLVVLALVLGLAARLRDVDLRTRASSPWRALAPMMAVVVAVAAMPVVTTRGMVDPGLDHADTPPAAWITAGALLDEGSSQRRVMQLPGAEFGAFDWGVTVDPPQPGLMARPFLTRDLLPLGSPVMMDLQYAVDDRVQDATLEPEEVAGVARLLAVDTLWVAGDIDVDRYGTTPPAEVAAVLAQSPGLGSPTDLGPVDDASGLPTVRLVPVDDPVDITRVASRAVLVVGSGDGVIDSVAAGLLDGTEGVITSASLATGSATPAVDAVVLTDSNRDRAHHWRGSQDVWGMTGPGGPDPEVTRPDESDVRFDLDATGMPATASSQTTATLRTSDGRVVEVVASTYGRPFTFLPERRAAMAVDGDPATAWTTAEGVDPVGESIRLGSVGTTLHLLQPTAIADSPVNRTITAVRVDTDTGSVDVALDERSLSGTGQAVTLPAGSTSATIRIVAVSSPTGSSLTAPSGVGFAEVGVGPLTEVVRLPDVAPDIDSVDAVVLTRLRVGDGQTGRTDPEPALHREFGLPSGSTTDLTLTVSPGTNPGCRDDLLVVDGTPVPVRVDGASATTCDGAPITLAAGEHRVDATGDVRRVTFATEDAAATAGSTARVTSLDQGRTTRDVRVDGCAAGCWLILGEGWNRGWTAASGGVGLGSPTPMSGGNGWWLPAGPASRSIRLSWTGQGGVDLGLGVSALVILLCLVIVVRTRRARTTDLATEPGPAPPAGRRRLLVGSLAAVGVTCLVASPGAAALAAVAVVPALATRRARLASLLAVAGIGAGAAAMVARQVVRAPAASPLWPLAAERLHRPVLAAIVVVVAMAWVDEPPVRRADQTATT